MTTILPDRLPDELPDLRNLGVLLRVILAVNVCGAVVALAATSSWSEAIQYFSDQAAVLEPTLLLCVGLAVGLRRQLEELGYRSAVAVIVLLSAAVAILVRLMLRELYPFNTGTALRTGGFAALLAWSALGYFRLRNRALSPLLTEARLQALQARIRPHFLFNSINAVLSLIRSEPAKAERALEDLADLFRVFMAENRELSVLSREVELVRQYLDLEALRLGKRMRLEWHIDKMPGDALIPPLTLQPLLENAVYHGIEPATRPGVITINIFRARDEVHINIRNPHFANEGRRHAGNNMAMGNIRERLLLHFDAEASLKTTVGPDYYQVHLTLPYRPARRKERRINGRTA
ncbi:sensor histidine kinase [Chitinimonas lacunae]|uniref:Sensor histidine kinase n=1 Tax=Chitinimonas lacunae TaxID=1963018 RepID=A0ABV8MRS9_9NEIS